MNEMLKEIAELLLFTIITGCGIAVINKVIAFLNEKIDDLQKTKTFAEHEKLNQYIDYAQEAISTAVTSVSQTYVDSLKKSGQFDKAAANNAKEQAIEIAEKLISDNSKIAIETVFGDFEEYINNKIEAIIKSGK